MPLKAKSAIAPNSEFGPTPRQAFDARRGSSCERGYGRPWRKLRKLILARDPLCRVRENLLRWIAGTHELDEAKRRELLRASLRLCDGMRPSRHVDHFVPLPIGDNSEANLQGACDSCHSVKTVLIDGIILAIGERRHGARGVEIPRELAGVDRVPHSHTPPRNENFRFSPKNART